MEYVAGIYLIFIVIKAVAMVRPRQQEAGRGTLGSSLLVKGQIFMVYGDWVAPQGKRVISRETPSLAGSRLNPVKGRTAETLHALTKQYIHHIEQSLYVYFDTTTPSCALAVKPDDLERVEHAFATGAQLLASGFSPFFLPEVFLQPVFAPSTSSISDQCRRSFMESQGESLRKTWFYARIDAEVHSRECPALRSYPARSPGQSWADVSDRIAKELLETLTPEEKLVPRYTPDELGQIRRSIALAVKAFSSHRHVYSVADDLDVAERWVALRARMQAGIELMVVGMEPEVVMAGFLHDVYRDAPLDTREAQMEQVVRMCGERVAELVRVSSCDSNPRTQIVPDPVCLKDTVASDRHADLDPDLRRGVCAIELARDVAEKGSRVRFLVHAVSRGAEPLLWVRSNMGESWASCLVDFAEHLDSYLTIPELAPMAQAYLDNILLFSAKCVGEADTAGTNGAMDLFGQCCPLAGSIPGRNLRANMDEIGELFMEVCRTIAQGGTTREACKILLTASWLAPQTRVDEHNNLLVADGIQKRFGHLGLDQEPSKLRSFAGYPLQLHELGIVEDAVSELVAQLDSGSLKLRRNPLEQLSHSLHVAFGLLLSGCSAEVISAGVLHDLYELVRAEDLLTVRHTIRTRLSSAVDELLDMVTEPPKSEDRTNWITRKIAPMNRLLEAVERAPTLAAGAAAILCSSKVSTFSEGKDFTRDYGRIEKLSLGRYQMGGWSKGSWLANLQVLSASDAIFARAGAPAPLLASYRRMVSSWCNDALSDCAHMRALSSANAHVIPSGELTPEEDALLDAVMSLDRTRVESSGIDVRPLIALVDALQLLPDKASLIVWPRNPRCATVEEVEYFLQESLNAAVFIHRGYYINVPPIEAGWLHVIASVMNFSTLESSSYLGNNVMSVDIRMLNGDRVRCRIDARDQGLAIVDPVLSALGCDRLDVEDNLEKFIKRGSRFATDFVETLIEEGISERSFAAIWGTERERFAAKRSLQNRIYLEMLTCVDVPVGRELFELFMVRQGTAMRELVNQGSFVVADAVAVYENFLGSILMQVSHYRKVGDKAAAKMVLQYLFLHAEREFEMWTENPDRLVEYRVIEQTLLLPKLLGLVGRVGFEALPFVMATDPESELDYAQRFLQQLYEDDFYDESERCALVQAVRGDDTGFDAPYP